MTWKGGTGGDGAALPQASSQASGTSLQEAGSGDLLFLLHLGGQGCRWREARACQSGAVPVLALFFFPDKSRPTCRSTSNWGSVNQKETSSGNWGSISWPVTLRDGVPSLESCRAGPCPELRIASPCAAGAARCRAGLGTGRRGAGSWLWLPRAQQLPVLCRAPTPCAGRLEVEDVVWVGLGSHSGCHQPHKPQQGENAAPGGAVFPSRAWG